VTGVQTCALPISPKPQNPRGVLIIYYFARNVSFPLTDTW